MLIYIALISLFAVILTVHDKKAAQRHTWRVREMTLIIVAILGGSVSMLITMLIIRHKTKHIKFMLGLPLIIVIQVCLFMSAFNSSLYVSHYSVKTDNVSGPVKLLLVSDLHSYNYGENQSELLNAVHAENPDAILMSGDIFDDRLFYS
jgi:uncharacterized membrane protein YsdA (DUF1294 family)